MAPFCHGKRGRINRTIGTASIDSPDRLLLGSIEQAVEWFRKRALAGTNVGASSVNSIYRDIIASIVRYGQTESTTTVASLTPLIADLQHLRERNEGFAQLGLTPELEVEELIGSLKVAGPQTVPVLKSILGPYLDGHRARLDALQEVQQIMSDFASLLTSFYSHKLVSVRLNDGLKIISTRSNADISVSSLSSGEKQLLLLLCHAVSVREPGPVTVFMIDEPEISLNVKWQRKFVEALLTCLAGTNSQIILATHSIELLARYKDSVVALSEAS